MAAQPGQGYGDSTGFFGVVTKPLTKSEVILSFGFDLVYQ